MVFAKQVNDRSPLRIFERSIHGGLGPGHLGVVASRAGVGKTSFLVGIALDDLMRGRRVFHASLDQPVEHVREYYDEVFADLARRTRLTDVAGVHLDVERHRQIHAWLGRSFTSARLRDALGTAREQMRFVPSAILVDGFPFEENRRGEVAELVDCARSIGAEIWMSARTHRDSPPPGPGDLPSPLTAYQDLVSVVVTLESAGDRVRLRLLKDHESPQPPDLYLDLDPATMLLVER